MSRIKGELVVWFDGGRLEHRFPVDISGEGFRGTAQEALDSGAAESYVVDKLVELHLEAEVVS